MASGVGETYTTIPIEPLLLCRTREPNSSEDLEVIFFFIDYYNTTTTSVKYFLYFCNLFLKGLVILSLRIYYLIEHFTVL